MADSKMTQEEIDNLLKSLAGGGDDEPSEPEEQAAAPAAEPPSGTAFTAPPPMSMSMGMGTPIVRAAPKKPDKKFKIYDFKNPKIFSKDQLRRVQLIYDTYAKHLSSFMSGKLRTECTISIFGSPDETKYSEYNNDMSDSIMMGVFETKPLEGNMLIELKKETAYLIIEKLLGWVGEKPLVSENDFTDIEIKICEKFFTDIGKFLKEAWSNVTNMEPRFDRIETNARLTQLMPFDDVIILIMFKVIINEYEGSMRICVPCLNLESLLAESENYLQEKRRKKNEDTVKTKKDIFERLKTSKVDVRGILGKTTLSLQDLLYLQVGDYIELDTPKDSPITVKVGTLDWYKGEIGEKRKKMAVKIISELQAKKELQKIL